MISMIMKLWPAAPTPTGCHHCEPLLTGWLMDQQHQCRALDNRWHQCQQGWQCQQWWCQQGKDGEEQGEQWTHETTTNNTRMMKQCKDTETMQTTTMTDDTTPLPTHHATHSDNNNNPAPAPSLMSHYLQGGFFFSYLFFFVCFIYLLWVLCNRYIVVISSGLVFEPTCNWHGPVLYSLVWFW